MRQLTPSTFNKDSTKYSEVVTSLRSGETIPLISKSSEGNLAFASGNTYNSVKEVLGRVTHISDVTVYQNVNSLPAVDSLPLGTICVALTNGTFPMYRYQVQAGQNWNRWATLSQVLTDSLYVDDTTGKVYRATATSPYFVEVGSGGGGIAEFDGTSFNPLTAGLESGIYRCTNLEELAIVEDGEEVGSEWVGPDGLLILSANDPEYYYSYIEAGYLTWIGWSNDGENVGVYSQICQNNDVDDFLNHHGNAYRSDVAINELLAKDMIRDIQSNTTLANSKQSKIIKKLGVSVGASDWASDSTQTGYSYKAFVSIPEVLATNTAVVTFSTADVSKKFFWLS